MPKKGKPEQVALNFVPFWIQVHNIPPGFMIEKLGKDIANYIGEFLAYDDKNNSNYLWTYMKIKVLLDVISLWSVRKKIKRQGEEATFIKFKYERLGNFCYYCGCLGHKRIIVKNFIPTSLMTAQDYGGQSYEWTDNTTPKEEGGLARIQKLAAPPAFQLLTRD